MRDLTGFIIILCIVLFGIGYLMDRSASPRMDVLTGRSFMLAAVLIASGMFALLWLTG